MRINIACRFEVPTEISVLSAWLALASLVEHVDAQLIDLELLRKDAQSYAKKWSMLET